MRRILAIMASLVLAFGLNVTPVAAHNDTCFAGYFCAWPLINYDDFSQQNNHEHFSTSENDWPLFGLENDDDSAKNMESYRVIVYADSGYANSEYCMTPGEVEDDIHDDRDNDGDSNINSTLYTTCGSIPSP